MIDQIGIGMFGVTAIWLSQDKRESRRRWACWCGLAAQPFWIWTTIANGQWVILGLTMFYTWSWFKGVRVYWGPTFRAAWREFMYAEVFPTHYDPLALRAPRLKIMQWLRP